MYVVTSSRLKRATISWTFPRFPSRISSEMNGLRLLILLLSAIKISGELKFTSTYEKTLVTGVVGSSFQFNWSFTGDFRLISWGLTSSDSSLDENLLLYKLLANGNSVPLPATPAAYVGRVGGIVRNRFVTFTLHNLKLEDAKLYGCKIDAKTPPGAFVFDIVELGVESPPNITGISANQSVNEGKDLTLNCSASGNPTPNTTWTKLSDNSVVTMPLTNISRTDEGGYRCSASNSIGNPATKDVFITVNYKPKVTGIGTSLPLDKVIQGQNVTLICQVTEGKPPVAEYQFYHNNHPLSPETIVSNYTIYNVRRSQHYGNYKCSARNDAGVGESDVIVLDIKVPAQIRELTGNITVNESSVIDLTCDATGHPSPNITWTKDGYKIKSGSNVLHISSSVRRDSGAYVCIAANSVKAVKMKTYVIVHYQPNITSVTPLTKCSWIGQRVQLTCVADGSPTPSITWKKPDGTELRKLTSTENTVDAQMKADQDFGNYTCEASNIVGAAATRWVQLNQIKPPLPPNLTISASDIRASSLVIKWAAPTDDGGSPVTGYNLIVLHDDNVIVNETTSAADREYLVDSLSKSTTYTLRVSAKNRVFQGAASEKKVMTKYEGAPATVEIIGLPSETRNVSVTIKWNKPGNNGAPITQYTVYQRIVNNDNTVGTWNKVREVKDLSKRQVIFELAMGEVYQFVVTATNKYGESLRGGKNVRKLVVLGDRPEPVVFITSEGKDGKVTVTWKKPEENGAAITRYTIYKRIANVEEWMKVVDIRVISPKEYVVQLEKGKKFDLVLTATNKYGESSITNENIKTVDVPSGVTADSELQKRPGGVSPAIIAGAAAVGVLLILGLIILLIWRKRRKTPSETGSATAGLQGPYPGELEDGYSAVGAPCATQQLQAVGPVTDVTYAQVDKSKKKSKAPVTDVYAEVDKSKKSKKKRSKQPGELEYAELDDFRPNTQSQASGATARPLVRAPVYEGTEYADITQFGVPQNEPTYDNVPRGKDVVYSNVESM